jgi:hypothetical protein
MHANLQSLRRPQPLTVAGSTAPTLPRPPAQLQDHTDRALADELLAHRNGQTLRSGGRHNLGHQERRRRPQLAGYRSVVERSQQASRQHLQQSQPQLPWQRVEQSSDNATDLAEDPASGQADAPADVVQGRESHAAAASVASAPASVPQESVVQRRALQLQQQQQQPKQQAPSRRKAPAESKQEQQRRLRREALSESYWQSQVDMSTGFPVPLGYAVQWQQPRLRQPANEFPSPSQQVP